MQTTLKNKTISVTIFDNKNKTIQARLQQYNIKTKKWGNLHEKVTLTESKNINVGEKCNNSKNNSISDNDFNKNIRSCYQKILKRICTNTFMTGGNSEYFVLFEVATKQVIYVNILSREIRSSVINNKRHETNKGVHFNTNMPLSKIPVKQPLVEPFQSDYVDIELPLTQAQNEIKELKAKIKALESQLNETNEHINNENTMNNTTRTPVQGELHISSFVEDSKHHETELKLEALQERLTQLEANEMVNEPVQSFEGAYNDINEFSTMSAQDNSYVKPENTSTRKSVCSELDLNNIVENDVRSIEDITVEFEYCYEVHSKLIAGEYGSAYSEVKTKLTKDLHRLVADIGVEMKLETISKSQDNALNVLHSFVYAEVA